MATPAKINEMVAFHILEWSLKDGKWFDPRAQRECELTDFTTDLNAAWKVAELICDKGFRLQLSGSRAWTARFYKSVAMTLETLAYEASDRSPAMAICKAALAAKKIEIPTGN
jgi:hypothetical protein